jgi:hypothetical protein
MPDQVRHDDLGTFYGAIKFETIILDSCMDAALDGDDEDVGIDIAKISQTRWIVGLLLPHNLIGDLLAAG